MAQLTAHQNSLTSALQLFQTSVRRLLQQLRLRRQPAESDFAYATTALNALPLASDDYARIAANLENAETYLSAAEWGAAQFELRTSLQRLTNVFSSSSEPTPEAAF